MAAGAQATRQGWRWPYQTLGIFNAIFFLVFLFLYEETKYVPVLNGQPRAGQDTEGDLSVPADPIHKSAVKSDTKAALSVEPNSLNHELNFSIPMNTWRKRLALWSPSPEPMWPYFYRPFLLRVVQLPNCVLHWNSVCFRCGVADYHCERYGAGLPIAPIRFHT